MKKIGIVITDGVGFRNFILSDFINQAENSFNQVVIYSCLPKNVYKGYIDTSRVVELSVFKDSFFVWFFMKMKEVAHYKLNLEGNFGIQDNYNLNKLKSNSIRGYAKRVIYAITKFLYSEKWIHRFNRAQQFMFKRHAITKEYLEILSNDQVDFLFFTHQRPPYIAPLIYAAEQLRIKTGTFIFSWDNIASKGRMAGNFKFYFVWSQLMKTELLQFYKKIIPEQISIVGTPQFEPYVMEEYVINRTAFFEKFNLDEDKKTICYSCADSSIGVNDEVHIKSIYNYIKDNPTKNIQLLIRTSPAEDGSRFKDIKEKYPEIKWNIPKWLLTRNDHVENWSQRLPSREDVVDLKSILQFSDLNINMCSTMSLDFMLFDKPVINTVFGNQENGLYDDQRFLNFAHYKNVVNSKAVTIAKNEKELHSQITEALNQPSLRQQFRKDLINLEISKPLKGTSKGIIEAIKSF